MVRSFMSPKLKHDKKVLEESIRQHEDDKQHKVKSLMLMTILAVCAVITIIITLYFGLN